MAETAELKAQASQPPKTPGNSSVPPSVGFKANRAERRARKRRRGHDGISRRRQRAGRDRAVSAEHLPGVWRAAAARPGSGGWAAARWSSCRRSGRWWSRRGSTPPGVAGCGHADQGHLSGRAGADADVRAADRGAARLLPRAAPRRLRAAGGGLSGRLRPPISEGGIDRALRRLAERARPTYEAIGAAGAGRPGDRLGRDRRASGRARRPGSGSSRRPRRATTSSCPAGTPR